MTFGAFLDTNVLYPANHRGRTERGHDWRQCPARHHQCLAADAGSVIIRRAMSSPMNTEVFDGPRCGVLGSIEVSATRSPATPKTFPAPSTTDPMGAVAHVCNAVPRCVEIQASRASSASIVA